MLLVFLLSACSYDDLVLDSARDQQDVLKRSSAPTGQKEL